MDSWIKKQNFNNYQIDFDELECLLADLIEETVDLEKIDSQKPLQLFFTLKFDRAGDLHIEKIGSRFVTRSLKQFMASGDLTDINENEGFIVLTLEIPFLKQDDFNLLVTENKLVVFSINGSQFKKEFLLMSHVHPKIIKSTFKNGILEVVLKKR